MVTKSPITEEAKRGPWGGFMLTLCRWLDSDYRREDLPDPADLPEEVNWQRTLPFIFLHLGCLAVLWVGVSWISVAAVAGRPGACATDL